MRVLIINASERIGGAAIATMVGWEQYCVMDGFRDESNPEAGLNMHNRQ